VLKQGGEAWIYEIRKDATEEARAELRKKYGRFIAFVSCTCEVHSSIKLERARKCFHAPRLASLAAP